MLLAWKTSIRNPDPSFDPDDMVNMEDSFMKIFEGLKERKDRGGKQKDGLMVNMVVLLG